MPNATCRCGQVKDLIEANEQTGQIVDYLKMMLSIMVMARYLSLGSVDNTHTPKL